jgi:glycosyltransferase involved in cell wall biosynthesis
MKNRLKEFCIITSRYPTKYDLSALVFVQKLVWAIADERIKCTVICPIPINLKPKHICLPMKTIEKTYNDSIIDIYFPKYFSFGQSYIYGYNPVRITTNNFTKAVGRVINKMDRKPDVLYGHFITPAGIAAARIGRVIDVPSFLSYGESSAWSISNFGLNEVKKELNNLSGIISVSQENTKRLLELDIAKKRNIGIFLNAIDDNLFYPHDKTESRKKLGIPIDKFIIAFVGHFIKRKGIDKLIKAVDELDNVYAIYAGKGTIYPRSIKTLYSALVKHENLPWFYSAADIFVLPTLNEGCCNAIIEAMASGLPIISSNASFNDDILDDTNSIRIDPKNIEEIKGAIKKLYNDKEKLHKLRLGSLRKAKSLTIENRAKNIIEFINEKSNLYYSFR